MLTASPAAGREDADQRVFMNGLDWWQFEAMLAVRGDAAGVRVTYLEGTLELMSPSHTHEFVKKMIARLLEAYAEETGVFLNGLGSLTMKNPRRRQAAEPDECYAVGSDKEQPDLAIEVIWTSGGLGKREIYAGLGVRELWEWRKGRIEVLSLQGGEYVPAARSELLPDLDVALLATFVETDDQTRSVRAFREKIRLAQRL